MEFDGNGAGPYMASRVGRSSMHDRLERRLERERQSLLPSMRTGCLAIKGRTVVQIDPNVVEAASVR